MCCCCVVFSVIVTFALCYKYQETGCSPLSTACKCGAVASAELLLEYGANPNGCKNVSSIAVYYTHTSVAVGVDSLGKDMFLK